MSRQRTRRELDKSFAAVLADATMRRVFYAEDGAPNKRVEVWRLTSSCTWVDIVIRFGPYEDRQQIIVTGDFVGDNNGWISELGYSIGLFGRQQSADYLCSKFMRKDAWVPELAAEQLLDTALEELREIDDGAADDRFRAIDDALLAYEETPGGPDDVCRSAEALYDFFGDVLAEDDPGELISAGYGYDPDEAARLCAIQRRFVELYAARLEADKREASAQQRADLAACSAKVKS